MADLSTLGLHGCVARSVLRLGDRSPILRCFAPQPRNAVTDESVSFRGLFNGRIAAGLGRGMDQPLNNLVPHNVEIDIPHITQCRRWPIRLPRNVLSAPKAGAALTSARFRSNEDNQHETEPLQESF
jgi:hypothetical protein